MIKAFLVAGARPNFMKVAPILRVMREHYAEVFRPVFVHTGQHYDFNMSDAFIRDLRLPEPDVYLGVSSASHAEQTGKIMVAFEQVLLQQQPELVMVVGDVNSTLACAITTSKIAYPASNSDHPAFNKPVIAHVEAGLRSFDRSMPEEINRIVTDALSDFLFTTCKDANENLRREGIPREKIFFVGNVMIDSLLHLQPQAADRGTYESFGLRPKEYGIVTLHRPANVDHPETLERLLSQFQKLSGSITLIFPIHPRTRKTLRGLGLEGRGKSLPGMMLVEPLGYLDFLNLMLHARFVLTDSGGIQEETTFLHIPCLTLRENTERPITIQVGTNKLVTLDRLEGEIHATLNGAAKRGSIPELWDGKAAERIVRMLCERIVP